MSEYIFSNAVAVFQYLGCIVVVVVVVVVIAVVGGLISGTSSSKRRGIRNNMSTNSLPTQIT